MNADLEGIPYDMLVPKCDDFVPLQLNYTRVVPIGRWLNFS